MKISANTSLKTNNNKCSYTVKYSHSEENPRVKKSISTPGFVIRGTLGRVSMSYGTLKKK